MATKYPPFMNAYGNIERILKAIKKAKTPSRFTQDYLGNTLGFTGGSAKPFIPFAKRIGLLGSDGTPTDLYKRFRNADASGAAAAEAMRIGYSDLYERDESAHELSGAKLSGLLTQITGLGSDAKTLTSIAKSFTTLKSFADFKEKAEAPLEEETPQNEIPAAISKIEVKGLSLGYNIHLNLPATDDMAIYNAIFKSLRQNLLT